jgi:hypothetical protein
MLKITVEILPAGVSSLRRTLAVMTVGNISELADVSSYEVSAMEAPNRLAGTNARSTSVQVIDHDRRQSVWELVGAAIAQMRNAEWDDLQETSDHSKQ